MIIMMPDKINLAPMLFIKLQGKFQRITKKFYLWCHRTLKKPTDVVKRHMELAVELDEVNPEMREKIIDDFIQNKFNKVNETPT
jgi:hypothetical protein